MPDLKLYGKPREHRAEGYESPPEYADQGDTRIIRNLGFRYLAEVEDPAGDTYLHPVNVPRNATVNIHEIGLLALARGERSHAFYTIDELTKLKGGRVVEEKPTDVTAMGEYELAEHLKTGKDGKPFTGPEVVDLAGEDKELAHRLLQAENIQSGGDPRKSVEAGLKRIIEAT